MQIFNHQKIYMIVSQAYIFMILLYIRAKENYMNPVNFGKNTDVLVSKYLLHRSIDNLKF